jgi:predicted nucleic acid-binding protein
VSLVVIDASAMVELLLSRPGAAAVGQAIVDRSLLAPGHFDAEVLGGLFRAERLELASTQTIERAVHQLERVPVERVPVADLVSEAWAYRHNLSAADALYVTLAKAMSALLVTADRALARAPLEGVTVTLVG